MTDAKPFPSRRYTAIIPVLNAAATINRQLEVLRQQTLPPEEILVVDSGSGDDTVALAEAVPGSHIHYDQYNSLEDGSAEMIIEKVEKIP